MFKLKRTAVAIPSLWVLEEPLFFNSFLTTQMLQPASLRICLREACWRSVIDPLLTIGPSVNSGLMEERQFPYVIHRSGCGGLARGRTDPVFFHLSAGHFSGRWETNPLLGLCQVFEPGLRVGLQGVEAEWVLWSRCLPKGQLEVPL